MKFGIKNYKLSKLKLLNIVAAFVFLFVIYNSSFIIPASAHVLKSDGSIGAVMHVTPEDDPIAGETTGFFFEFKDKESKFLPQNCNCTIKILQNGKELLSQNLFANNENPSLSNSSLFFVFPTRNVYTINITGEPKTDGTFEPFNLTYDLRVSRTSDSSLDTDEQKKPPIVIYTAGALVMFFSAIFVLKKIRK